jgi:type VI secretion system protein ImpK
LQDIEQLALSGGYDGRDVQETHFAVAAYLDSVVLHSEESVRAEWERKTLQEEMFGQRDAGVVFFEKLEDFRSRRDSEQLAGILEVYLLCLLLGFEGRYSGGLRSELEGITERVRKRIEDIRALRRQISPSGDLPPQAAAAPLPRIQRINHLRWYMLGAAGFTLLCFVILKLILSSMGTDLLRALG